MFKKISVMSSLAGKQKSELGCTFLHSASFPATTVHIVHFANLAFIEEW